MGYEKLKEGQKTNVPCDGCGRKMILLAKRRGRRMNKEQIYVTDLLRCAECSRTVTYDPVTNALR